MTDRATRETQRAYFGRYSWGGNSFAPPPTAAADQNLSMRALIIKVLIGIVMGIAIILVFVLFAHSSTPV